MCGIAGFAGKFPAELLERMNGVQAHRGPDDAGLFHDPVAAIGLAHRRLSILDVSSAGHQPMSDPSGRVTIVYNGEIYNFRELRAELEGDGTSFRSRSDTEVLLQLYLRHGAAMLERLNGIFAFALWDAETRRLLLARDGLGVKPLYLGATPRGLLFASELKALLEEPTLPRELDPLALHHHLAYQWCPAPRTMLAAVRKLPPGHAIEIRDGREVRRWSFYDLPYRGDVRAGDDASLAREVRDEVDRAVRRQMVSDVPIGAFLSGGLDSSAVVACAARAAGTRRLQCFTIEFDDDGFRREGYAEDLPYARRVAEHLDVDLHAVRVGPEIVERLEEMLWHLDEPQADPAPLNVLLISELARRHGIKVLLSGAGGDDIFSGYRRHLALHHERLWAWLPAPARRTLAASTGRLGASRPLARRLRKAFQYAAYDGDRRIASYFTWSTPELQRGLYASDLAAQLASEDVLDPLLASLSSLSDAVQPLDRMLYLEGKHFLADHNLNYTDKMGMACGVEIRVPLLDVELVRLAASLPVRVKQHGREGKWIFKRAMEPLLPRDVIYRPKTGFGAPLRQWLQGRLRGSVDELLGEASLRERGLFDPRAVRALVEADRAGRIDGAYTVFAILCIEIWCRRFLTARPSLAAAR